MGTRHIVGTILNGELHGSYAQYDGYPTGTGANLQAEMRGLYDEVWKQCDWRKASTFDLHAAMFDRITDLVSKMRYVDQSAEPTAAERAIFKDSHQEVSTGKDWYSYLREHQGSLMKPLNAGIATDQADFIKDSLFCEWGYIFDCDERKVHILKGFNTDRSKEWPRAALTAEEAQAQIDEVMKLADRRAIYYGCSLLWSGTLTEFIALDMGALEESAEKAETEDA